ncbi:MAG TPA: substrate-binding domain-containing protein [Microbacteriaceae bacterium]|nr:substrate-binding domain-containing protein [Microbacteriaceae bacterium]
MSAHRTTIADVARLAGVAASTASLAFSGKGTVSDATRTRVLDAAAALDYAGPDPRAASLRTGRSGIGGVVLEEHLGVAFLDPVKTAMLDGLTEGIAPLGAGLLLLRDHEGEAGLETAPLDAVVLIGCSGRLQASLATVRRRGIPVIVIDGDAGEGIPQITLDNRAATRQIAEYLHALGHRDVAIVTLPFQAERTRRFLEAGTDDALITIDITRERLAGAREVFPGAPAIASAGSFIDEGLLAGRTLLADAATRPAATRPTAIIAQSDLLAAGVIRAAEELGLRVPDDVSVAGFDGITVDGLAPFELATMVQPATEIGRMAGASLVRMLDGETPTSISMNCVFRMGNTTSAPRSSADCP